MKPFWAVQWRSRNRLDGETVHWIYDHRGGSINPALFRTRAEARAFIKERCGFIAERPDLQSEPHGWQMPRAVKVNLILEPV